MREFSATMLILGMLGLLLFVPVMIAMHNNGGGTDCLAAFRGLPCVSLGDALSHIQTAQGMLIAITQQSMYLSILAMLTAMLFALFAGTRLPIPAVARTKSSYLRARLTSVSLVLRRAFAWQSRFQHSPTLS